MPVENQHEENHGWYTTTYLRKLKRENKIMDICLYFFKNKATNIIKNNKNK